MADPRGVAANLTETATAVSRVPATVTKDLARLAVDEANQLGGKMKDGTRLTAEVRSTRGSASAVEVTVEGTPAGAWTIKTYGRRGGYTIRAGGDRVLNLRSAAGGGPSAARAVRIERPTSGDGRWDDVIEATGARAGEALDAAVGEATGG